MCKKLLGSRDVYVYISLYTNTKPLSFIQNITITEKYVIYDCYVYLAQS